MENTTSRTIIQCPECRLGRWSTQSWCDFCVDQEEAKAAEESRLAELGFLPTLFVNREGIVDKDWVPTAYEVFQQKIRDYRFKKMMDAPWRKEFHYEHYPTFGAKVIEYMYIFETEGVEGLKKRGLSYYDIAPFIEKL